MNIHKVFAESCFLPLLAHLAIKVYFLNHENKKMKICVKQKICTLTLTKAKEKKLKLS